ncbi:phosphate ABC transporter substrate-binding protein [Lawsonibacter sp. LCP25S3_G6]|uniref:phosphate ABC transporter substrate-binding protein n=1 Tax=unclassified Lawsonibacter TaxID=2617946 RepID=UPI003F9628D4
MKKLTCLGLSIVMALSLLTACGGGETSTAGSETGSTPTSSAAQSAENNGATQEITGTVNTDGSTSMADVMAVLQETFKEVQPGINVNYTGSGSGSGITNVLSGTVDIGLSSRALKAEEEEQGAVGHIVALDGVAVVVNPENTVADLTVEQIAKIFSGEITNWSEVGGADAEIAVFGRESGSGTRGAFEEIVGVVDACAYTNEYSSTGDMVGAVAGNPNAIGYASLSAVDESVIAVKVNNVAPSEATVKDGTYEIQRPFVMFTKEGTELSEAAQAFLDYAMSAEVAEYIAAAGAVSPQA